MNVVDRMEVEYISLRVKRQTNLCIFLNEVSFKSTVDAISATAWRILPLGIECSKSWWVIVMTISYFYIDVIFGVQLDSL